MIIAIATGNGLRSEIRGKVIGFSGNIQILNYQPNPTYEQTPVMLSDSLLDSLRHDPQIERIQPFARKAGILKTDKLFEGAVLKGIDHSYDISQLRKYLKNGHIPHIQDSVYNDSIVISTSLAHKLKLNIGDKVSMYFVREAPQAPLLRKFYVSGFYQTDFEEIDNSLIIGDLKHIQRMNKWDKAQVGGYEIFLKPAADDFKEMMRLRALIPYETDALTARQLNEQLFQWLDLFDLNIIIIIVIMVLVATINMSIALLILILERTQMIGILKALGSRNLSIRKIFLINAGYLILRGLFWGNLIGLGLCYLQKYFGFIKLDPATYYVSQVSIELKPAWILALDGGTMLVCIFCLILPSYLITRISPVKAIRFD